MNKTINKAANKVANKTTDLTKVTFETGKCYTSNEYDWTVLFVMGGLDLTKVTVSTLQDKKYHITGISEIALCRCNSKKTGKVFSSYRFVLKTKENVNGLMVWLFPNQVYAMQDAYNEAYGKSESLQSFFEKLFDSSLVGPVVLEGRYPVDPRTNRPDTNERVRPAFLVEREDNK